MAVKTTRAIAVWWEDAFSHDAWTHDADQIAKGRCLVLSVGLEIRNDETGITLALSFGEGGQKGGVWKIPRGMVRKTKVLGLMEAPKEG